MLSFGPQANNTLVKLDLYGNKIGDKGALGIADGLKVCSLFPFLALAIPSRR